MSVKIRNEEGMFEVVSYEKYLVRKHRVVLWHWIPEPSAPYAGPLFVRR